MNTGIFADQKKGRCKSMRGFSLIETMIALVVLAFGLLIAGQMLFVAASSSSMARSKGAAALVAQDRLESLASLYRQDPSNPDLLPGNHGPLQEEVTNPENMIALNRFSVTWKIAAVPDPRPKPRLDCRRVDLTVTPALAGGDPNSNPTMNKILSVSTVLAPSVR